MSREDAVSGKAVSLEAVLERKTQALPRYAVVPDALLQGWGLCGTTTVEGTVDGRELGRRSLKRWDEDRWFLEFPEQLAQSAGFEEGNRIRLTLWVASSQLPEELEELIKEEPRARACWEGLTESRRRMLREQVLSAKQRSTRTRRARRALLGQGER